MLEKEIENILVKYHEIFWPNHGLVLQKQQLTIDDKRFDLLFKDKYNSYLIVEVKRGTLLRSSIDQTLDYYGKLQMLVPDSRLDMCVVANVIPANIRHILEERGIDCREIPQSRIVEIARRFNEPVTIEDDVMAKISEMKIKPKEPKVRKEPAPATEGIEVDGECEPEAYVIINEIEYGISEIRILPMSKEEFPDYSIHDLQICYFLNDLIANEGRFRFSKTGMSMGKHKTFILFQFSGHIVASALLNSVAKFETPEEDIYCGAYQFDVDTIHIFHQIGLKDFQKAIPEISKFSNVKQRITFDRMDAMFELLKENTYTENEFDEIFDNYETEPEENENKPKNAA